MIATAVAVDIKIKSLNVGGPVYLHSLSKSGLNMVDNQWTVLTASLNALHEENHHSMPASVMCITTTTLEAPVFLLTRLTGSTPVI